MTEPDAVMVRIGEGIALREQGERVAAHDLERPAIDVTGGVDVAGVSLRVGARTPA